MKTTTKITAVMLLSVLSFASVIKAEDMSLPVINKPSILDEGTQRELTPAQIAEILPWAKDSKIFLVDLLENVQGLLMEDKVERLVDGIKQVVGESASKNSEMLMRYALNRGLVINDIITKNVDNDVVGSVDAKFRILRSSIDMAIKYYDVDMAVLSRKTTAPFVAFGVEYFNFLTELNKSVFDASAQYAVLRTALEWLQWDLYRDLNNAKYAPQIVKINNALKTFPNKVLIDAKSIASIRQMKSVAVQLKLSKPVPGEVITYEPASVIINNIGMHGSIPKNVKADAVVNPDLSVTFTNLKLLIGDQALGIFQDNFVSYVSACKLLGYEKAFLGIGTSDYRSSPDSLAVLDSNGKFMSTRVGSYKINNLTCYNQKDLKKQTIEASKVENVDGSATFTSLTYKRGNKIFLIDQNNTDSYHVACRILGFKQAIIGTGLSEYKSTTAEVVQFGSQGDFLTTKNGSYSINKLTCN